MRTILDIQSTPNHWNENHPGIPETVLQHLDTPRPCDSATTLGPIARMISHIFPSSLLKHLLLFISMGNKKLTMSVFLNHLKVGSSISKFYLAQTPTALNSQMDWGQLFSLSSKTDADL